MPAGQLSVRTVVSCYICCAHSRVHSTFRTCFLRYAKTLREKYSPCPVSQLSYTEYVLLCPVSYSRQQGTRPRKKADVLSAKAKNTVSRTRPRARPRQSKGQKIGFRPRL